MQLGALVRRQLRPAPMAVIAVVIVALMALPMPAEAFTVHAMVNGVPVTIGGSTPTVQDALDAAGIALRVGLMRSASTGEPLPDNPRPPHLWRRGEAVQPATPLRDGDRLRVVNGVDYVEPTFAETTPLAPDGFPPVESGLWRAGQAGALRQEVGRYSRQVAAQRIIERATAPTIAGDRSVVLSFDDGPDGRWTPLVLDVLKAKHVHAVFCLVGMRMRKFPDLVRRIHDEGHVLCDHTEHHIIPLPDRPPAQITSEIETAFDEIRVLTGVAPPFYRGPGGRLSPFIISEAHRLGMRVFGWTVDPGDYHQPGADVIQDRVALSLASGGVALMHDAGGNRSQTVAQLPGLIDRLRSEGYTIAVP